MRSISSAGIKETPKQYKEKGGPGEETVSEVLGVEAQRKSPRFSR